jgi:hypothetical protein
LQPWGIYNCRFTIPACAKSASLSLRTSLFVLVSGSELQFRHLIVKVGLAEIATPSARFAASKKFSRGFLSFVLQETISFFASRRYPNDRRTNDDKGCS